MRGDDQGQDIYIKGIILEIEMIPAITCATIETLSKTHIMDAARVLANTVGVYTPALIAVVGVVCYVEF